MKDYFFTMFIITVIIAVGVCIVIISPDMYLDRLFNIISAFSGFIGSIILIRTFWDSTPKDISDMKIQPFQRTDAICGLLLICIAFITQFVNFIGMNKFSGESVPAWMVITIFGLSALLILAIYFTGMSFKKAYYKDVVKEAGDKNKTVENP